jgi:DNA-binding Xre family transcriptional regulator
MADGPSVLVTLRLGSRDRLLLEGLVERERRELEALGVEASLSSVMRKLIRAAAKASAVEVDDVEASEPARRVGPASPLALPAVSQEQVRALLRKKTAERRGLGAELARKLGVERAQVSRFKAGKETFPASKLDRLYELLTSSVKPEHR